MICMVLYLQKVSYFYTTITNYNILICFTILLISSKLCESYKLVHPSWLNSSEELEVGGYTWNTHYIVLVII